MEIIDSHCHLHFEDYDEDREEVIKASINSGVSRIINVGTSLSDSQKAVRLASSRKGFWATAGVHPHGAVEFLKGDNLTNLQELFNEPKVVAVGEVGLDYYREYSPRREQEKILRLQIEAGLEAGLPFIFHIREAFDGFWPIFDEYSTSANPIRGVVHSFSASPPQLQKVVERGLYIGLNGLLTYTKEETWLESARQAPLGNILLETDAPFLSPVPDRGKRCEPRHTVVVAKFLANLRGELLETIATSATANTIELFGLDGKEKLV